MNRDAAKAWLAEVITDAAARRGGISGLARTLGRSRNTVAAWKSGATDPSWLDVLEMHAVAGEKARSIEIDLVASAVERVLAGVSSSPAKLESRIAQLEARLKSADSAAPVGVEFTNEMQQILNAIADQGRRRESARESAKRRKRSA